MSTTTSQNPHNMTGLVLTAGGARGAYHAGVLKRISEIPTFAGKPSPFKIITGASAGAINGAAMAANNSNISDGAKLLTKLWSNLSFDQVMRYDPLSLAHTGIQAILDFSLGGIFGAGRMQSFVDATPLRHLLETNMNFSGIDAAIQSGDLYALGITATGYHSGKAFTFIQGQEQHPLWNKSRRVALKTNLNVDHVLASAAIPLVFQPVALKAGGSIAYFGDGAMRLTTPLSPAIRLGAERLLAIGVRCQESADSLLRSELSTDEDYTTELQRPPLSQICGTLMNAIFLDHLDADIDHLVRMNEFVAAYQRLENSIPDDQRVLHPVSEPMRVIKPLVVSPSADIAIIAKTLEHRIPKSIRYLMEGLGQPDARSADLTSFLLFDQAFTRELIALGYHDAGLRIHEIEHFLMEDNVGS
jgi:NTE family protein